ncbi:MAG: hemolysin family protein [Candidatus Omnitrophota bacterium]
MISLSFLIIGVLLASSICSMAEAAILSLPLVRARILSEEKRRNSKTVLYLKEHINTVVASIVVVNNAINIIGAFFIGQKVSELFGNEWLGLASAVMTLGIIVFGEVIPKTIGERYKAPVSLLFARPLWLLVWILGPFVKFLVRLAGPVVKGSRLPKVTEEEIKHMLELGRDSGTVEMDEEVLCKRVFKLNDLQAFQMMKPIDQIFALPGDKTLSEMKETILNAPFSRIAVYDKDPLNIVGMVYLSILLKHIAKGDDQIMIKEFMTKPIVVHHLTKADALLAKFIAYNQHLFIVQNDAKKDLGLLTMEDVLEELFGEIYDEKDIKHKARRGIK